MYKLTDLDAIALCSDPTGLGIERQTTPFYYYAGERIYLQVDSTRLTVALDGAATDTTRLRDLLGRRGVVADSLRPLWAKDHWFVYLPSTTSSTEAERVARGLRLSDDIQFASSVYFTRDDHCSLYLVNRLVVRFRDGARPAEIERLNQSNGVRNEQRTTDGTRQYEYPPDLFGTPLELAAHYYRQQIVDWAEADKISGCLRLLNEWPS